MNYKVRYAVLAVLTIGVTLTLAFTFTPPLLYSLGNDLSGSTPFHENVDALKEQSLNSTMDIYPELQDMINFAGPISLTIEIHDFEDARRYLELFGKNKASIKNLIVRLDMEDSEIQELEKNTDIQRQILESLLNTSVTLDALQSMELQYYSESAQEMRMPFRLRGNELRKKVQEFNQRYRNATEKVDAIGTKLGLDVTKNKESAIRVEQIIREIGQPETTELIPKVTTPVPGATTPVPVVTTPVPVDTHISLAVKPETGKYRENIEYSGVSLNPLGNTTPRSESNPVIVYIDEKPFSTAVTDKFGFYTVPIPVEKLQPGNHTVYSNSPTSRSENRTLTVTPVDSATYFMAGNPDPKGNVLFAGIVEANTVPVRSAPVQIAWDQSQVLTTKTDEGGYFEQKIQLSPGRHTVVANFSGEGYPINPSESSPLIVDIPLIPGLGIENGQIWLVLAVIGFGILVMGGVIFYLQRMTKGTTPPLGPIKNADIPADQTCNNLRSTDLYHQQWIGDNREYGNETLIALYSRLLMVQGLSAASLAVYKQLAGRIANDFQIRQYKSLTARELSRNCRGKLYCGAFFRFVAIYEWIRYGGKGSVEDRAVFETALTSTDEQMEREKQ